MTMRLAATVLTAALLAPATGLAQTPQPICQNMIDRVAQLLPDLGATPDAAEKMNLTEEQLEAVLASLDAARIVKDTDPGGCLTLVNAARTLMLRGQAAIPEDAQTITDLRGWSYQPLYDESWRANAVIDAPVHDRQGNEVGEVEDILMHPDGTLTAIIVEAGGFLDIGDQHMRVAWEEIEFRREDAFHVVAPITRENLGEFSLFEEDGEVRQSEVRITSLLNETVRLKTGQPYGYVYDALIREGQVKATVMRPDVAYAGRREPFAAPYYAYELGYSPGYDFYLLPYESEQLTRLEGFDIERVRSPEGQGGSGTQTQ